MTLIGRQIETLRNAGISDVVIVTGYLGEMLTLPETRRIENPRWAATNMVDSLFCAEAAFGDDVIVCYGDIAYEPRVLAALLDSPHEISVMVDRNWRALWELRFEDPLSDAESLRLDADDRILEIGNPVTDICEIEAQYMGLMRFRGGGVKTLCDAKRVFGQTRRPWMEKRPLEQAYMTDLLMEMILRGDAVHGVPTDGGWIEIDTVEDYENIRQLIATDEIQPYFDPSAKLPPQ